MVVCERFQQSLSAECGSRAARREALGNIPLVAIKSAKRQHGSFFSAFVSSLSHVNLRLQGSAFQKLSVANQS